MTGLFFLRMINTENQKPFQEEEALFRAALEQEKKAAKSEAELQYKAALEKNPKHIPSRINLAAIYKSAGRISEALKILLPVEAEPVSEVHEALGNILSASGKAEEALAEYDRALELSPGKIRLTANNLLTTNYVASLSQSDIFKMHTDAMRMLENSVDRLPVKAGTGEKIRLGFVSGDLKRHSVTFFLEPVLALLDRKRFEIFLYSDTTNCDAISERIKTYGTWHDITKTPDSQSAQMIASDKIDILFDLSGHTGLRMGLFAMKPAPVEISWLGYFNTTGLSTIDWRICDEWTDLPGQEAFHTEKLLRIPGGFQVYAPPADAPKVSATPCLQNGYITFGSFNSLPKMNRTVVEVWARILKGVPGSKLLLKANGLADKGIQENFISMFRAEGIDETRLLFSGLKGVLSEHLSEYSKVDIALDTFPLSGATTTCEALWMGVPVITLATERHAGRVGVSILKRLGLESFITGTKSSYIAAARSAAQNPGILNELRNGLRKIMAASPLCDAVGFTKKFEEAMTAVYPKSQV